MPSVARTALVVEDDALLARSLVASLERADPPWRAESAPSMSEARARLAKGDVAVTLLDLVLPDGDGRGLIPLAREAGASVVVLSVLGDERTVYGALSLGASGYLVKPEGVAAAAQAADDALAGGAPISPRIARWLVDDLVRRTTAEETRAPGLTAREREVLVEFANGATYAEVAKALGLSINTIRQHVRAIYEKLHVSTKTEAVLKGLGPR